MNATAFHTLFDPLQLPVLLCSLARFELLCVNPELEKRIGHAAGAGESVWDLLNFPVPEAKSAFLRDLESASAAAADGIRLRGAQEESGYVTAAAAILPDTDEARCCLIYLHPSQPPDTTLSAVLDNIDIPVMVSDFETNRLLYANRYAKKEQRKCPQSASPSLVCAYAPEQRPFSFCAYCPKQRGSLPATQIQERRSRRECHNPRSNTWYLLTDALVRWTDGKRARMETAIDISELKRKEEQLRQSATLDTMTGAFNRDGGLKMLQNDIARRNGGDSPTCICFMDLDGLKKVNDTYGHDEGDAYILSFVKNVRTACRASDIVCRWGGDEFLLCLGDCTRQQALKIMHKVSREFEKIAKDEKRPYEHRFSYGVIEIDAVDSREELDSYISMADEQMYFHKKARKENLRSATSKTPEP